MSTQTSAAHALQITLSDIAALARVQRPVVSMWRKRSQNTDTPFPDAVAHHGQQELFDAAAITGWLAATGRGNNPHATDDVAAFAAPLGPETRRTHFAALTALIALRCLADSPLAGHSAEDLLDLADEIDPDDDFLFTELEALGADLLPLAAFADQLSDASYTAPAAFEQLLCNRYRSAPAAEARTALTAEAIDLVATTAVELAAGSTTPPVFTDDGGSDFLLCVADILGESAEGVLCVGALTGAPARLARRRMYVHGQTRDNLEVRASVSKLGNPSATAVRLAQFPSPAHPETDPVAVLTAIDNIALDMDENASAVILAPATILSDALQRTTHNREAEAIRSDVLRSGRVRAIVRLPENLLSAMPRQAQALWVLGEAHKDVDIAQRWTMVADVSTATLSPDVRQDLVSDLAASMGSREQIRAHSFRFATLIPTRSLLAAAGSLTASTAAATPHRAAAPAGQAVMSSHANTAKLVQAEQLVDELNHAQLSALPMTLSVSAEPAATPTTVGAAIKAGTLKYLPGHRIAADHLEPNQPGRAQLRVLGVEELDGERAPGSRRISQLVFASNYPSGRLTEPGDVIFSTGAQGTAMVDTEGAAVVLYPARILRIEAKRAGGLVAAIVAKDLQRVPGGHWRKWPVRRIDDGARPTLSAALASVTAERQRVAVRLQQLDELSDALMDGAAQGSFRVLDMTMEGTS